MTISEAMRAVDAEYSEEALKARESPEYNRMMAEAVAREYLEIDKELPRYVAEIALAMGVKPGRYLPPYAYQIARMCFRLGMRVQRKLDHPDQPTTTEFWKESSKTH